VNVDVHELKVASERLEEAETRYRNFIEHSTEGIWRFENETPIPIDSPEDYQIGQFLDHSYLAECNVAMAVMYGYERPEELVGQKLRQFVPPGDMAGLETYLRTFIRSGYRLSNAESHEHDRHGRSVYFLNNLVGVVEDSRLMRSWGTQRDISERRQMEEEARQARKMETAGRLAGGIAHDFNNLLTAILGTSEILLDELPEHAPARADVEEIKRAATRAANLTRQLLAFSRRQVLQPRVLDLTTVVQGVETMLRRLIGEHINLMTQTGPELWRVRADPGQLEQVVINLCVNARDAMPTGGTLLIEVDNFSFAGTMTGAESVMPAGDYVRLTVSDSGTGMDPETLHHLFEPFFTTKEPGKGTGLGLATVYGIVKQSGGFIYADSARGAGSRFRIYLPRVTGVPDMVEPPEPTIAPQRAEGTLLLVEDEAAVRRLARRVLEGVGYRVLEASSGAEAMRLVEQWEGPLDLVVTDVIMPGMSGQELSARLRVERPWLRILYVSGYTDDAILQHGNLLPNTGFLQKPFTPGSLAQRVREVMGR
jgi:two-component system, cell cycle sensor histidine kinase and response regulator CckA